MAGKLAGVLLGLKSNTAQGAKMFESREARQLWNKLNDTIEDLKVIPGCRDSDPDAWFPTDTPGMGPVYNTARKLCNRCPVQALCLEYAIVNNEGHGVWGGLTYRERLKLKRGR